MSKDFEEEYKLYIEYLCERIRIPYIVFAFILVAITWILIILFSASDREAYLVWLTKDFGVLWRLPILGIFIMMRRLRNLSVSKFLDPSMPYSCRTREHMQYYLYIVFSPHMLKKREFPQVLKRWYFLVNHLYSALLFSLIAGFIGFIFGYLDPRFGYVVDILSDGIGVATIWFFVVIMGYMMIGVTAILRKLFIETKNIDEKQNFSSIIKTKELKDFPLNILYSYLPFMITLPAIISFIGKYSPWRYGIDFILIAGILSFLIVLIIPSYYVHMITKNMKENLKTQAIHLIGNLEDLVWNESPTRRDLRNYEFYVDMIERIDRVQTGLFSVETTVKVLAVGIIGNFPTIFQLITTGI